MSPGLIGQNDRRRSLRSIDTAIMGSHASSSDRGVDSPGPIDCNYTNAHRRIFRGPTMGGGRRGSFERHLLEGLFIRAFCASAFCPDDRRRQPCSAGSIYDQPGDSIVRRIQTPRFPQGIPRECLEVVSEDDKERLFDGFVPVPAAKLEEAADLIGRLKKLSPETAERFAMKTADRKALPFRLLFPKARRREEPVDGYYALSYRWQSHSTTVDPRVTNWQKYEIGIPPESMIASPVSDVMFEAIMEELPDGNYGLWCDQVCINQADDQERGIAVGMMDAIYRAAAKVVIALDDIDIDIQELNAMREFSTWHDSHTANDRIPEDQDLYYMRDKPDLRSCAEKILYSEYFDRAWCAHEFELASDKVVLVRTKQLGRDGRVKVVRIEDSKLHSLMLLLTLLDKPVQNPDQAARRVNVELLASRADRDEPGTHSQMVHDMQTLALITSMKTGGDPTLSEELRQFSAMRDKMSIILNASDVALNPAEDLAVIHLSPGLAESRIYQYLSLTALAAGNPLVLTTTSSAIPADEQHESWIRRFWLLDARIYAEVPPLPTPLPIRVDTSPGCRWVELDMLFPSLSEGGLLHRPSEKCLKHAASFITDFQASNVIDMATQDAVVLDARREYITDLLACILECRWTWGYGPIPLGMTTPSPSTPGTPKRPRTKLRMKYSTEKPWQYFFGEDLDRIPDSISWSRKDGNEQERKTARDMASDLMSGLLLTAPLPETRGDVAIWRPAWFEIGGEQESEDGGSMRRRYIAMVPRDDGTYRAAIPKVLKGHAYSSLARCWIMEKGDDQDNWVVRNRSKLVMETDMLEQECDNGLWKCASRQKIWGRTLDAVAGGEGG